MERCIAAVQSVLNGIEQTEIVFSANPYNGYVNIVFISVFLKKKIKKKISKNQNTYTRR